DRAPERLRLHRGREIARLDRHRRAARDDARPGDRLAGSHHPQDPLRARKNQDLRAAAAAGRGALLRPGIGPGGRAKMTGLRGRMGQDWRAILKKSPRRMEGWARSYWGG